jgi:hypothetical protein
MRTLIIGRSAYADVVLADASIAAHHAELVITADGRYYLTDCGSRGGTWRQGRRSGDGAGGALWSPVRQAFVGLAEPLRLGDHACTVKELLKAAGVDPDEPAGGGGGGNGAERAAGMRERLRGRVERDAATGEIVPRRR